METDHIDKLLERYLHLLHQYTSLREQLSGLQTGMYQDIARANFAAERGMRFGQDHYDERMQASRRVSITTTTNDDNIPKFSISSVAAEEQQHQPPAPKSEEKENESQEDPPSSTPPKHNNNNQQQQQRKKSNDSLRWYGLLAPAPLRQAQTRSVEAVEHVIPQLVSVSAQMAGVEIEVRRARKKRAKAEAAAARKEGEEQGVGVGAEIAAS
ncbi:hypothetical protein AAE478_003580 [Parahypoxylon ruwenzoriense]